MTATSRPAARRAAPAAKAVGWLAVILAVGSVLLAVAHAGVSVPLLSSLGPGGDDAVPQAAAAFTVAAVLATFVAVGAFRQRAWAWALGLVVYALTVLAAVTPYRGVGSLLGVLLGVAGVAVLLSRSGRAALLPRG